MSHKIEGEILFYNGVARKPFKKVVLYHMMIKEKIIVLLKSLCLLVWRLYGLYIARGLAIFTRGICVKDIFYHSLLIVM